MTNTSYTICKKAVDQLLGLLANALPANYCADIVVIGGAAMVKHGLLERTADIDFSPGGFWGIIPQEPYRLHQATPSLDELVSILPHMDKQRLACSVIIEAIYKSLARDYLSTNVDNAIYFPDKMCFDANLSGIVNGDNGQKLNVCYPDVPSLLASKLLLAESYLKTRQNTDTSKRIVDIDRLLEHLNLPHATFEQKAESLISIAERYLSPNRQISGLRYYLSHYLPNGMGSGVGPTRAQFVGSLRSTYNLAPWALVA